MNAKEIGEEIDRLLAIEKETHSRIKALRACMRARITLDAQIAADEQELAERTLKAAGKS